MQVESDASRQFGADPCPQLVQAAGVPLAAGSDVVGLTELEEVLELVRADLTMNRRTAASDQVGW